MFSCSAESAVGHTCRVQQKALCWTYKFGGYRLADIDSRDQAECYQGPGVDKGEKRIEPLGGVSVLSLSILHDKLPRQIIPLFYSLCTEVCPVQFVSVSQLAT